MGKWLSKRLDRAMRLMSQARKHWASICRKVEEAIQEGRVPEIDISCLSCACCRAERVKSDCLGCPIAWYSGYRHCVGTPWREVYFALESYTHKPSLDTGRTLLDACIMEYFFLVIVDGALENER